MKALWIAAFGLSVGLVPLAPGAHAEDQAVEAEAAEADPRIAENPAIAALYAEDPVAAEAILEAIDAIHAANANRLPKGGTRSVEVEDELEPAEEALIEENPAFQELYARDREATLKLIKLVIGE